jgi:hypothetical protein
MSSLQLPSLDMTSSPVSSPIKTLRRQYRGSPAQRRHAEGRPPTVFDESHVIAGSPMATLDAPKTKVYVVKRQLREHKKARSKAESQAHEAHVCR